ncbi:MAG: hypothetical protein GW760_05880 [Legionella sp.]|jgi:hypothetical protein|nr:hypothetical protein [Legionella sp.]
MTPNELLIFLQNNCTNLPVYGKSSREFTSDRSRKDGRTPSVYHPENIQDLLSRLDAMDNTIRFVIDQDQRPYFGETGPLKGSVPGHEEMCSGLSLASGTLTLSHDRQYVVSLDYQSGYFRSEKSSLNWILHYLCSKNSVFKLGTTLDIAYFNESTKTWPMMTIEVSMLKNTIGFLRPKAQPFLDGVDEPYATYASERPAVHTANGLRCSGSFENLIALNLDLPPVALPENVPPHHDPLDESPPTPHFFGGKRSFSPSFFKFYLEDNSSEPFEKKIRFDEEKP